ncbi:MAG TPA: preprotein translocase subunit SecY [Planctomycetota bacterium]|nr:preprotein translocase subunit SecY [Planctomycetota bacterium]HRR81392.1 preprotein translocase subunit SecY [Planctomycetota bacterium]HRT94769.1 preprotein translocase subunit SecY [Planctomycetota bacterium]
MLRTFANIFRVPDLRKKVLVTLFMIVVFRLGTYVPLPGINTAAVTQVVDKFREGGRSAAGRALSLIDLFTGGALGRCTVFALGIMPYISASIIFQLLTTVIKPLEELQREGEAGRKKINQYTRYATVVLCMVQSFFMSSWIEGRPFEVQLVTPGMQAGPWFEISTMLALTAGSVFLMWLGETLTEHGIGNGISVLIMAGIVDRMPTAAQQLWNRVDWSRPFTPEAGRMNVLMLAFFLAIYLGVVVGVVMITQGQRRVTVQQAKHTRGHRVYGGQRHYMPLRVGQAGVIPIIFAQSLLTFPNIIFGSLSARWPSFGFIAAAFQVGSFTYTFVYILLIVFFCYFWTAVVFNPLKMAEEMKNYGHFVPGIRPGKMTAQYLERLMTRITLAGSAFLAFIAVLPQLIHSSLDVDVNVAYLYGGTSLLIIVGVALEIVQKIESHLLMRHYEGFMKKGRIHGRSSW